MVWSLPSSALQPARQFLGSRDIRTLRALVAATQENDERVATLHEIDAIAGPVVNAHFADAASDGSDIARVAKRQAIDPCDDLCPCPDIPQISQPTREFLGSPDRGHV